MSSLYDKYYSNINKNYIYDLACKLIKDEYKIDISDDKYFKEIYEKNVTEAFENTETDDIVILNRKLLQLQIESYKPYNKKNSQNISLVLNVANRFIKDNDSIYDFDFIIKSGDYCINNLIIVKDNSILFSNPLIIININGYDIYLKLLSSHNLNDRTYLEFIPIDDNILSLKDKTEIKIMSSLKYFIKIDSMIIKNINEDNIEVTNNTCQKGDTIKINNNILIIKNIENNKNIFLDNIKDYKINKGDKIININESPILILKQVIN
tara:strand:- start:1444 stop:2241 length:798 start_codon:yes stop_codon:yes gene_type:complete